MRKAAEKRLERVKTEQGKRIEQLQAGIADRDVQATILSQNVDIVEKAILVVRSAVATGMSWEELSELIKVEKANSNPIAGIIHSLKLDRNEMVVQLESKGISEGVLADHSSRFEIR